MQMVELGKYFYRELNYYSSKKFKLGVSIQTSKKASLVIVELFLID